MAGSENPNLSETAPAEPPGLMSWTLQTAGLGWKKPAAGLQEHAKNRRTHALSRFALPTRLHWASGEFGFWRVGGVFWRRGLGRGREMKVL